MSTSAEHGSYEIVDAFACIGQQPDDDRDLSAAALLTEMDREGIGRALDNVGPLQLVFGSDSTLFDPLVMLAQFERLQMSASDRALVMSGNAQRIFNIKLGCGG